MPILRPSLTRTLFLFLAVVASGPGWGAGQETGKETSPAAQKAVRSHPAEGMERLAEYGIKQAVQAIAKNGAFYPFAFLQDEKERANLMGYEGPPEKAPPPDQFARNLFEQIQVLIRDNPQLEAAAIFRMHMADHNGEKVPGVWCLVDHRNAPALIVFQPLVPKGDGSSERVLGEVVYQQAEDALFPEEDRTPTPSAD